MPVGELARRVTVREFINWQLFAAVHPFPAEIMDLHGAMALALQANINRDPKSTPNAYTWRDFVLLHGPTGRPVAHDDGMTEAQRMRAAFGG